MSPKAGHIATAYKIRVLLQIKTVMNDQVGNEQSLPYNLQLFASVKINGNGNDISSEFGEK